MKSIALYVIKTAIRDRFMLGLGAGLLIMWALGFFLGGMAIVEQGESSVAMLGGMSRLWLVAGLVLFTCFHVKRVDDSRELAWWLTRAIPRWHMVLAYWLGLAAIITLLVALLSFILWVSGAAHSMVWGLSLLFECWIVAALSLMFALSMRSGVMSALIALVTYGFSRTLVYIVMTVDAPIGGLENRALDMVADSVVRVLFAVMPRLDMFANSAWLAHADISVSLAYPAMQLVIYVPLLLTITAIDLSRKEF